MADEMGSDGLRQKVAMARASAGAAAPPSQAAIPPDERASFWTKPMMPQTPPPPPIQPAKAALKQKRKNQGPVSAVAPPPETLDTAKRREKCMTIVNSMLDTWVKEQEKSTSRANNNLAREIMHNGAALIYNDYPIDQLRSLIALSGDLIKKSQDDGGDKFREATEHIRDQLMMPVTAEPDPTEEEEPGEEEGE